MFLVQMKCEFYIKYKHVSEIWASYLDIELKCKPSNIDLWVEMIIVHPHKTFENIDDVFCFQSIMTVFIFYIPT